MRLLIRADVRRVSQVSSKVSPETSYLHSNASLIHDASFTSLSSIVSSSANPEDVSTYLDFLRVVPISPTCTNKVEGIESAGDLPEFLLEIPSLVNMMDWPKEVMEGDREEEYEKKCLVLASGAREIEILDPWIGEKLLTRQNQLWLITKLMEDCPGDLRIVTREPEDVGKFPDDNLVEHRYTSSLLELTAKASKPKVRSIEVQIKRYTPESKVTHNRAIRFLFHNGVSSDHALEHGVEAFGRKRINEPDLARISSQNFSQRKARLDKLPTRASIRWENERA